MRRQAFLGPDGVLTALLSLLVVVGSCGVTLLLVLRHVRRVAHAAPSSHQTSSAHWTEFPPGLAGAVPLPGEARIDPTTGQPLRALVLGFRLTDGAPCPVYRARLLRAVALAEADPCIMLVLLGGITNGGAVSEAAAGRGFLIAHGVAASRVAVEEASRHTLENLCAFREGFSSSLTPDLLVTSRAHLARALAIAEGLGLRFTPCAAEEVGAIPFMALLREAVLLHWYRVGAAFTHATYNRRMLARIT